VNTAEIKTKLLDGTAVLYPGPYLNQLRGERIEVRCKELLATGVRNLVINFEETELVNSIGISLLLSVFDVVEESSGNIVLSNLSNANRELFDMLGILSSVELHESEDEALARLSGGRAECGEAGRGEASRGQADCGEASRGEAISDEANRSKAGCGEASRGDGAGGARGPVEESR
jgi:anti-anti-sigma factor